jgi:hypothetical protein
LNHSLEFLSSLPMKNEKAIHFAIRSDVYPLCFVVWAGPWDDARIRRLLKAQKLWNGDGSLEQPNTESEATCCYTFGGGSLIWMPRVPYSAADFGLMVHEIVHAVAAAGRELGFGQGEDAEEFYIYLAQFLTTRIVSRLFHKTRE